MEENKELDPVKVNEADDSTFEVISSHLPQLIEESTENQLLVFDVDDKLIADLKEKYSSLSISGVEDKEGYKNVDAARKDVKKKLAALEDNRVKKVEAAVKIQRMVNERAKELKAPLVELRDELVEKQDAIDEAKERMKREEAERIAKVVSERVQTLIALGLSYDGIFYEVGNFRLSDSEMKSLEEAEFGATLEEAKAERLRVDAIQAEEARIAAEEKARKDEEERVKREKEEAELAEKAETLRKQTEELDRQKKEFELEKEAARKRDEEARLKRINEERAEREKLDAEKKKLEEEKAEIARVEKEKKDAIEAERKQKEAADKAVKDAEEARKKEEETRLEKERKQLEEANRQLALRPDKVKLQEFASKLIEIGLPDLATDEAKQVLMESFKKVKEASNYIVNRLNSL